MQDIIKSLHPLEREIIPLLKDGITSIELTIKSKRKEVEVMRALQWLENKKALKIKLELKEIIHLGELGKKYKTKGLPERRLLKELPKAMKDVKLPKAELNIAIGELKKRGIIELGKQIKIKNKPKEEFLEEKFLKTLPRALKNLQAEEKHAYENLKKRKDLIETKLEKIRTIELTTLGKKLTKQKIKTNMIEALTPKMIKSNAWKGKEFRHYDVEINVPKIQGGKRHFVKTASEYGKKVWLEMGFEEMTGPHLDSSFWVFDALFTAQDHPVRDLQDTFYIKSNSKLPKKELVNKVKQAHENGIKGSKGWQYKWDEKEAKKNVLRTHTTNLSARTLANLDKKDIPKKFFSLGRCYRNESLDWCHIFEFNQTEGIVIDPNANFKHLLGYLTQFAKKMGFPKVRFRPAHFPYTEPSVEGDVYDPIHKKWVEFIAAGVFRPEVVVPLLGEDIPVLAWGPGFDRIITSAYKIKDIRELYKNDIKQLKETKHWMR
ncbi:phenylalanine--tRNA ligase subunit alpha [archaeon]|nr:phenylalanine--tRNA ligase subunit alpha [archaeon]